MNGLLYWHTIRYLKAAQILGRLGFALKKRLFKPLILRSVKRYAIAKDLPAPGLTKRCFSDSALQNLEQREFKFLAITARFKEDILWNDPQKPKLWLYNLHYFEYLLPLTHEVTAAHFNLARSLIEDWLRNNPPGQGNGWEPYPISLRVVNWLFFYDAYYNFFQKEKSFKMWFLNSLYQQVAYLTYFLETHLQANHLWANVKTVLFAGLFFDEEKWIKQGIHRVRREIQEQILADGGHYERSPTYHALILTDLIDLANLINKRDSFGDLFSLLRDKSSKMLRWLQAMTQPDGKPALFGDTAFDVAPCLVDLKAYFEKVFQRQPEEAPTVFVPLNESGYLVFKDRANGVYFAADVGKLGVTYQPGHAHCDFLSYELSVSGRRFIVDTGVGEYEPGDLRTKARGTYGHNVLVVNGMGQAEIWSAFRMGRRIRPQAVRFKFDDFLEVQAEYSNRLKRKRAVNYRRVFRLQENKLEISDFWQGRTIISVENLIHLHPRVEAQKREAEVILKNGDVKVVLLFDETKFRLEVRDWFYVPRFGEILNSKMLVLIPTDNEAREMRCQLRW